MAIMSDEQEVLTFVSDDLGGLEEEAAMLQVHHLSLETILHHIHQSQLVSQVLSRGGAERRGEMTSPYQIQFTMVILWKTFPILYHVVIYSSSF